MLCWKELDFFQDFDKESHNNLSKFSIYCQSTKILKFYSKNKDCDLPPTIFFPGICLG